MLRSAINRSGLIAARPSSVTAPATSTAWGNQRRGHPDARHGDQHEHHPQPQLDPDDHHPLRAEPVRVLIQPHPVDRRDHHHNRRGAQCSDQDPQQSADPLAVARPATRMTPPITSIVNADTPSSCQNPCRAYSAYVSPSVSSTWVVATEQDRRLHGDEGEEQRVEHGQRHRPFPPRYRRTAREPRVEPRREAHQIAGRPATNAHHEVRDQSRATMSSTSMRHQVPTKLANAGSAPANNPPNTDTRTR